MTNRNYLPDASVNHFSSQNFELEIAGTTREIAGTTREKGSVG